MLNYKIIPEWPTGYKYSPQAGLFYRNKSKTRRGGSIGHLNGSGYMGMRIFGYGFIFHHRLAFLAMTAKMPGINDQIDHINGIKTDNRFENLRIVDVRNNQNNKTIHRNGKLVGAVFCEREKLFVSRIRVKNKRINLGHFKSEIEAHEAYMEAKNQIEKTGILEYKFGKQKKKRRIKVGKAIRDDQISRNGTAELEEGRGDE